MNDEHEEDPFSQAKIKESKQNNGDNRRSSSMLSMSANNNENE